MFKGEVRLSCVKLFQKNWGVGITLLRTNIALIKTGFPKRKVVSPQPFFKRYINFWRGVDTCVPPQPTPATSSSAPPVRQQLNSSPLDYSKSNLLEPPGHCRDQNQLHPSLPAKKTIFQNVPTFFYSFCSPFLLKQNNKNVENVMTTSKNVEPFEDESHVVNSISLKSNMISGPKTPEKPLDFGSDTKSQQLRTCRATQSLLPFTSSKPNSKRMPRPDRANRHVRIWGSRRQFLGVYATCLQKMW